MNPRHAAVVICTSDRSNDVANACEAASRCGGVRVFVVVDASAGPETEEALERFREHHCDLEVHYVRALRRGTARQRNQAAEVCNRLGVEIMHFIDDDTEVLPGYFQSIEARFAREPNLAGVGAVIENAPPLPLKLLKRFFLLSGHRDGTILRSGRVASAQYPWVAHTGTEGPQSLDGCAMSYRTQIVLEHRFDERLEGYSVGEDMDFGFRIAQKHPLAIEASARCLHRVSHGGLNREKFAYLQVVVIYCWVREHRSDGMSLLAFWWSILGDFLLHAADGIVVPHRGGTRHAKGVLKGVATIAAGRATRSATP